MNKKPDKHTHTHLPCVATGSRRKIARVRSRGATAKSMELLLNFVHKITIKLSAPLPIKLQTQECCSTPWS
jgi:hypothetical protein